MLFTNSFENHDLPCISAIDICMVVIGAAACGVAKAGIQASSLPSNFHKDFSICLDIFDSAVKVFLEHNVQETSKDIATLPFGSDQSLKKAAPVTAVPMEPIPVRSLEEPWVA